MVVVTVVMRRTSLPQAVMSSRKYLLCLIYQNFLPFEATAAEATVLLKIRYRVLEKYELNKKVYF
jgi:hypothetical protein